VLEANGLKVVFLAYTEYADSSLHWSYDCPRTFLAGEGVPGCNVVYPTPYHPWNNLPDIARKTIDLGACLVLGTHPHHVQGCEVRGNGLIAYSPGQLRHRPDRRHPAEGFRPQVMEVDQARALLEEVERISRAYGQRD